MRKRKGFKRFFSLSLAIGLPSLLLFFCLRNFDLQRFWAEMTHLQGIFLLAAFFTSLGTWSAMALQWKLFLPPDRPLALSRLFPITAVFAMLANTLPFYSGHALTLYLLGHREKVGKTAALSLLTLEQISDGFGKIILFAWIAFVYPFPEWMKRGMEGIALWVLAAYLVLFLVAYRFRERKEIFKPVGWKRIFSFITHWAYHLHAMRDFKKMIGGITLAVAMKGLEVLAIFLVQKSFGVELPFYSSFLVFAALSLTTVLPVVPGRLGIFEAAAYVIYQYLGIDPTRALTLGFFIHIVHTIPFLLLGYGFSLKLGIRREVVMESRA